MAGASAVRSAIPARPEPRSYYVLWADEPARAANFRMEMEEMLTRSAGARSRSVGTSRCGTFQPAKGCALDILLKSSGHLSDGLQDPLSGDANLPDGRINNLDQFYLGASAALDNLLEAAEGATIDIPAPGF